jgi:hypothetical protein
MRTSNGRTIGKVVALVIPVGVFLSLAACVVDDGPTGLRIVQDQWIEPGIGAAACTVPATATGTRRIEGVLDVTMLDEGYHTPHYLFYPLVDNELGPLTGLASTGSAGPVEEKHNIAMTSFHVKLEVAGSADSGITWDPACPGEFDVPVETSQLAPGGAIAEIVEIVRSCNTAPLYQYLQAQPSIELAITATIRAKGRLGSASISSPPFTFPVRACYGCLQTGFSDPTLDFPAIAKCADLTTNPYTGDPCNPAQDQLILCCALDYDAQGNVTALQCPASPASTTP